MSATHLHSLCSWSRTESLSTLMPVPENYSPPLCWGITGVAFGDTMLLCQLLVTLEIATTKRAPNCTLKVINNWSLDCMGSNWLDSVYVIDNTAASFAVWQILLNLFIMSLFSFLPFPETNYDRKETSASLIGSAKTTAWTGRSMFQIWIISYILIINFGQLCFHAWLVPLVSAQFCDQKKRAEQAASLSYIKDSFRVIYSAKNL